MLLGIKNRTNGFLTNVTAFDLWGLVGQKRLLAAKKTAERSPLIGKMGKE